MPILPILRALDNVNGQPVKSGDIFTKNDGAFTTAISLPDAGTAYKVQAYFTKNVPYDSAESQIVTIKSRNLESGPSESSVAGNPEANTEG